MTDLLRTTDAREWAKQFISTVDRFSLDVDLMTTWFANAIETGRGASCPPEERATVTAIIKLDGGIGRVQVQREDGCIDRVQVVAGGWGDGYPSYWPPRVGDKVVIKGQKPVVIMTGRKS